jgi:3-phenylpropionate/cinnamic acid dioxygenase small subunit
MVSFDQNRQLREWLKAFYNDVSYKMLKREMIRRQDYDTLIPDIRLISSARFLLKGIESMPDEQPWPLEEIEE